MKKSYEEWMKEVNRILLEKTGLDSDCLPDYRYRAEYLQGASPAATANRAIKHAKEF